MNFPYGQTQFQSQYDLQFQYPTYPQYPQQYPYYYNPQVPSPSISNPFFNNPVNIQPCQLPQINSSSHQPHQNSFLEGRKVEQIPFAQRGIPNATFEIKSPESKQTDEPIHIGASVRKRLSEEKKRKGINLLKFADSGYVDGVKTVLGQGVNPNYRDDHHQTALHYAAFKNRAKVIETLVKHGKIIKHANDFDRKTPLTYAIEMGNVDAVAALVACPADANYLDVESLSPLDHVFKRDSEDLEEFSKSIKIAKILLEKGAKLENCADLKSEKSKALTIEKVNKILNAAGVAPSVINSHLPKNVEKFDLSELSGLMTQTVLTPGTNHGEKPVDIETAKEGYIQKLKRGGQKKRINFFHKKVFKGNLNVVTTFINHFNRHINDKNEDGFTALHLAAFSNRLNIAQVLLKTENINKHLSANNGMTPLYLAIITGNLSLVKMLVSNSDDAKYKDQHGLTPLDYTFKLNGCKFSTMLEIVRFLVEKGAEFEKCSYFNPNFTTTKDFQDKEAVKKILHAASVDKPTIDLLFKNKDLKS